MKNNVAISVKNLTKRFKTGYGIENINFDVIYGKAFGYLGPNGSGKTTTIRVLLGFVRADKGQSTVLIDNIQNPDTSIKSLVSLDSWVDAKKIQRKLGYVPGEIALPESMLGIDLIRQVYNLRNQDNWDYVEELIHYWELDASVKIKKMSKGMKQKISLILAWMHKPDIFILDEPSTGLDPLMQDKFVKLVQKTKDEGKAIILSSHIFSEIEATCDYVAVIKKGVVISTIELKDIFYNSNKTYEIEFKKEYDFNETKLNKYNLVIQSKNKVFLSITNEQTNELIQALGDFDVSFMKEKPLKLQEYFMEHYENGQIQTENLKKQHKPGLKIGSTFELVRATARKYLILWAVMTAVALLIPILNITTLNNIGEDVDYRYTLLPVLEAPLGSPYLFLVLFIVFSGNSLFASEVEKGTLSNLLMSNQSRKKIFSIKIATYYGYITISVLVLYILTFSMVSASSKIVSINYKIFNLSFLGFYLLLIAIASICLITSCYFNKWVFSFSLSGALILTFYILAIITSLNSDPNKLQAIKSLNINSLFSFEEYLDPAKFGLSFEEAEKKFLIGCGVLFVIAASLTTGSYFIFIKKDLPL
ncbi:ABC transporter ATP-binding protein [Spiroplasma helicoides]|uniref:ABC transporter ATP-binding protein n=1 Tax=Spiroplasma helicoides TaxID=216938 RepID=A0A1B3SMB8_9MOLU|nr:ATP-binding cassette domain-containing protein [Spiroplasma helicoides]AOG61075.1 ABC transporter ATP-binding protein [Spiroplasma helicoides]